MSIFTWIITCLSLIGVVLNVRQDRRCFIIWCVTNSSWMVVDFQKGLYSQAFMFSIYLLMSIWGIYSWRHKRREAVAV